MNVKVVFLFVFFALVCLHIPGYSLSYPDASLEPVMHAATGGPMQFAVNTDPDDQRLAQAEHETQQGEDQHEESAGEELHEAAEAHTSAPPWTVIPFVALLLMIATGPLFYEHFWHKNYPVVAVLLAALVVSYYLFVIHNQHGPVHALAEYMQFIALLSSLFIASGGILIKVDKKATPVVNATILLIGAVISNLIGTTGSIDAVDSPLYSPQQRSHQGVSYCVFHIHRQQYRRIAYSDWRPPVVFRFPPRYSFFLDAGA